MNSQRDAIAATWRDKSDLFAFNYPSHLPSPIRAMDVEPERRRSLLRRTSSPVFARSIERAEIRQEEALRNISVGLRL
jgi:hypothetical protein